METVLTCVGTGLRSWGLASDGLCQRGGASLALYSERKVLVGKDTGGRSPPLRLSAQKRLEGTRLLQVVNRQVRRYRKKEEQTGWKRRQLPPLTT